MIFSPINIRKELDREKERQQLLLQEAEKVLKASVEQDKEIISRLNGSSGADAFSNVEMADKENIFSLEEIRRICVRYRLRFLQTELFRSAYPPEALSAIKAFEKKYGTKIESFRIIAPANEFKLENINKDPLLFAELKDNSFYLLYQWGHDLDWKRKFLTWPLQNLKTFLVTLLFIGFVFSFSLPSSIMNIFNLQSEIFLRLWLSIHTFIGLFGIALWLGVSYSKTFSSLNWNSKFYNY